MKFTQTHTRTWTTDLDDFQIVDSNDEVVVYLEQDTDPQNPREEYENIGTLVQPYDSRDTSLTDKNCEDIAATLKDFFDGEYTTEGQYGDPDGEPPVPQEGELPFTYDSPNYDPNRPGDLQRFIKDQFGADLIYGIDVATQSGYYVTVDKNPGPLRGSRNLCTAYLFVRQLDIDILRQDSPDWEPDIEALLDGEYETLKAYLENEVYGYVLAEHKDGELGEILESCWGYYGEAYAKEEAQAVFNYHVNNQKETSNA